MLGGLRVISIKNVNKFYGTTKVLNDVNMEINEGEIFGIIGHSGAGKSTLLRCINGLEDYQEGSVFVDNKEVKSLNGLSLRLLRKDLGMIFQHFSLLERKTVFDNVALPLECFKYSRKEIENRVLELLDLVGLSNKRNFKPRNLSGGQKQLVALAKVLLTQPQLLLLDEPTKGIDALSKENLAALIRGLSKHMTIVVASHDLEFVAKISDRVAMIFNGQMESVDTMREFFSQNLFYTTTINKIIRENNPEIVLLEDLGL